MALILLYKLTFQCNERRTILLYAVTTASLTSITCYHMILTRTITYYCHSDAAVWLDLAQDHPLIKKFVIQMFCMSCLMQLGMYFKIGGVSCFTFGFRLVNVADYSHLAWNCTCGSTWHINITYNSSENSKWCMLELFILLLANCIF